MTAISRREHRSTVIWPGFVDALATLLMVIIFLLLIFVMAQFFLGQALSGRDQALRELEADLSELSQVLALSRSENQQLIETADSLRRQLSASVAARAGLDAELSQLRASYAESQQALNDMRVDLMAQQSARAADQQTIDEQRSQLADLSNDLAALEALKAELEKEVTELAFIVEAAENEAAAIEQDLKDTQAALSDTEADKERLTAWLAEMMTERDTLSRDLDETRSEMQVGFRERQEIADSARAQLALMNQQMAALRQQLDALNAALNAAEADAAAKDVQIEALGQRLNAALAGRVQELSRYRSEFFGRLRELLGGRNDVRIVGDRFVLQSELLFSKGSAELGDAGKVELEKLATTLLEIALKIPGDLNWILRVDGHTDSDPIATAAFPSNWELSTTRALSVVHFLKQAGIPPERMAATGFAEFYPIAEGTTELDKARNRRIEFKFTQR